MADWHALYQALWKGRTFTDIEEAIQNELEDKLNHPRLRKKPEQKLVEAVRRVCASSLTDTEKVTLISVYLNHFEEIKQKH
ncbi:hypothetical protein RRU94_15580 [Domibacillus sp. DTU_2020_1001157_1_SI_ALB_TIR_016]|uniref:hypothetical protein n=1 Tax=Domibacillus sp. DTU_2020_1001157_1_SI_ALB_TIR_016 TaxID=3077789 RepID=UPI0028EBF367|nr:hypothetical protein [Domibacillus sp. DTU_2020_1001157_1_SI_ALB_TIR_016]WNS82170.1 hypothetical protein RRU94_15580 [Domibacillus sp. DTU_2020_1001157_1_SI_ALB_TIR_016]